ncbi:hypothetical protein TorRG33x02_171420 [Trema orientale]|uniref:Uncharacterized protein n=1 Tax=Trema orientale TaxID=63057 RepID=A0A2P5ENE3_TREOI|nr:hypothetical protein TorRG33x02_171420 [Trema orientale]
MYIILNKIHNDISLVPNLVHLHSYAHCTNVKTQHHQKKLIKKKKKKNHQKKNFHKERRIVSDDEYTSLVLRAWYFGEIAANITTPLSSANPSPKPLTTIDSGHRLDKFLLVCKNVSFSRSPVSAVATARP